jgi:hypothetical protein
MGILQSTVGIVRKEAEQIKASCKSATRMMGSKITKIRLPLMEKLEGMLTCWIEH